MKDVTRVKSAYTNPGLEFTVSGVDGDDDIGAGEEEKMGKDAEGTVSRPCVAENKKS